MNAQEREQLPDGTRVGLRDTKGIVYRTGTVRRPGPPPPGALNFAVLWDPAAGPAGSAPVRRRGRAGARTPARP
jgi:hypothetical protein